MKRGINQGMDRDAHFHLSFRYRFESAHRFTLSCADSCATPHGHTWYAEAVFASTNDDLGGDQMLAEFSLLKKGWKKFITEIADHSFMHHHNDPILGALREHIPQFRGLPFPGDPTTEMIAALFFNKLTAMHEQLAGSSVAPHALPQPVEVIIQETPTNRVRYFVGRSPALLDKINAAYIGWWQSPDPASRELRESNRKV